MTGQIDHEKQVGKRAPERALRPVAVARPSLPQRVAGLRQTTLDQLRQDEAEQGKTVQRTE